MDLTIGFPLKDSIGNLKNCWAFLGFLPDIGKLVIASVLLHVFFKMTHRRVLTLSKTQIFVSVGLQKALVSNIFLII